MADYSTPVKIDEFAAANSLAANSRLLVLQSNANTGNTELKLSNVSTFFANVPVNATFSNTISTGTLFIRTKETPANSTANVTAGKVWFDNDYLYIAVSNNSIKRIALSSF